MSRSGEPRLVWARRGVAVKARRVTKRLGARKTWARRGGRGVARSGKARQFKYGRGPATRVAAVETWLGRSRAWHVKARRGGPGGVGTVRLVGFWRAALGAWTRTAV